MKIIYSVILILSFTAFAGNPPLPSIPNNQNLIYPTRGDIEDSPPRLPKGIFEVETNTIYFDSRIHRAIDASPEAPENLSPEDRLLLLESQTQKLREEIKLQKNQKDIGKWLAEAYKINFSTEGNKGGIVIGATVNPPSNNMVIVTILLAP